MLVTNRIDQFRCNPTGILATPSWRNVNGKYKNHRTSSLGTPDTELLQTLKNSATASSVCINMTGSGKAVVPQPADDVDINLGLFPEQDCETSDSFQATTCLSK
jgi:hypothetical protein